MKKMLILLMVLITLCASLTVFVACDDKASDTFSEERSFAIDNQHTNIMGVVTGNVLGIIENLALNIDNTHFTFRPDGKLHGQIQTKAGLFANIDSILALAGVNQDMLADMLSTFYIGDLIDAYVEPMFPGFKAHLQKGDLKSALGLIERSLGFNVVGLDYEDEDIKNALKYIGQTMTLPSNLLEIIPEDTVLTLTFDEEYSIRKVVGNDGKEYDAIYIGRDMLDNSNTQPFAIFTMIEDEGVLILKLRIEFMNIDLGLKEMIEYGTF